MRAEERGVVVRDGTGPAGNRNRRIDDFQHECSLTRNALYEENDEPQPQERVEFGLMKLNPCRISVSS